MSVWVGNIYGATSEPIRILHAVDLRAGLDAKTKGRVSCSQSSEAPAPWFKYQKLWEAEATYLKQEPMQCARLVEVMRGERSLVLMAGAVVVSRPQRAGPVAVAWTGGSMQAPNKRFVAKEESSEKEHRIRIVNDTKMNWSFVE